MLYDKLTPLERQYLSQDGITEEDINTVDDVWTVIDYLTPLYGRFTPEWDDLMIRLVSCKLVEMII